MKLISIEGIDGSGKETLSKALTNELVAHGYAVRHMSFPNYKSRTGEIVKEYLTGSFGDPTEVAPEAGCLFFSLDRFAWLKELKEIEWYDEASNSDTVVVLDRWTGASMAYQSALGTFHNPSYQDSIVEHIREVEHDILGIPEADITLFLDTKPINAGNAMKDRDEQDQFETNRSYQSDVWKRYVAISDKFDSWTRLDAYIDKAQQFRKPTEDLVEDAMEYLHTSGVLPPQLNIDFKPT